MKVGDAYMEKQKCLEIAIKNLSKYEGYKLLALCGNEEDSIKIIDSEGIEHLYKFHFIISDGNEALCISRCFKNSTHDINIQQ